MFISKLWAEGEGARTQNKRGSFKQRTQLAVGENQEGKYPDLALTPSSLRLHQGFSLAKHERKPKDMDPLESHPHR